MPRRDLLEVVLSEFLWAEKSYVAALAEQTGLSVETAEAVLYGEIPLDEHLTSRIASAFGIERDWLEDESEPSESYSSRHHSGIDLSPAGRRADASANPKTSAAR